MADKKKLEQMLEHLINEDSAKAEELFHEYVVEKSREIYEGLIDAELAEESDEDEEVEEASEEDDEEAVEEAAEDDEESVEEATEDDDDMDEGFEDVAFEGDDEEMPDMGGDPTDDLESELGPEGEEGELADKEPAELFQDLDAIVDELQAKFDAMGMGGEEGGMGDEEMKDALEPQLATVREYVEKVSDGHGAEKKGKGEVSGTNTKSVVDNMKNDMGGTTANILRADVESESASTKGGLLNPSTKDMNTGNINVPGGKAGKAFSKKEPGHGAEKAGAKEDAENKQSLFRGRR